MQGQLAAIASDLERVRRRLDTLASKLGESEWRRRPAPERWSPIECVAHLNLTSIAMLPLIRAGLAEARASKIPAPARYRRDLRGWLIWWAVKKPGRFRTKTAASFVPTADQPVSGVLDEFRRLHQDEADCVRESDGLAIDRVFIASPFDARVRYNLYSALTVMVAHEHRHLSQAEES